MDENPDATTNFEKGDSETRCNCIAAEDGVAEDLNVQTVALEAKVTDLIHETGDEHVDETKSLLPGCCVAPLSCQNSVLCTSDSEKVSSHEKHLEKAGETAIGEAHQARKKEASTSDDEENESTSFKVEQTFNDPHCKGDITKVTAKLAETNNNQFCTTSLCMVNQPSECSPEQEAFETPDGSTITKKTACTFGECVKAVAELHDECTDLAGVRAGTKGLCTHLTAKESCNENTDAANHMVNLLSTTQCVSNFVKTLSTITDEEKTIVLAHSKFDQALSVTGKGGSNTCSLKTSMGHDTDAHCEAEEEDAVSIEPVDETDGRTTDVSKSAGRDSVKSASESFAEETVVCVDSESEQVQKAAVTSKVEPEEQL